jgi:hypothetical protein
MKRATIAGGAFAAILVLVALVIGWMALERVVRPAAATSSEIPPSTAPAAAETHPAPETYQGFLYGRVSTVTGDTYEGRLRWGGEPERSNRWRIDHDDRWSSLERGSAPRPGIS